MKIYIILLLAVLAVFIEGASGCGSGCGGCGGSCCSKKQKSSAKSDAAREGVGASDGQNWPSPGSVQNPEVPDSFKDGSGQSGLNSPMDQGNPNENETSPGKQHQKKKKGHKADGTA